MKKNYSLKKLKFHERLLCRFADADSAFSIYTLLYPVFLILFLYNPSTKSKLVFFLISIFYLIQLIFASFSKSADEILDDEFLDKSKYETIDKMVNEFPELSAIFNKYLVVLENGNKRLTEYGFKKINSKYMELMIPIEKANKERDVEIKTKQLNNIISNIESKSNET